MNCIRIIASKFYNAISSVFRSLATRYEIDKDSGEPEKIKTKIKNHFKLLALMYKELEKRVGSKRTIDIMNRVLMESGKVFFRGFSPLRSGENLRRFAEIYKNFEKQNIVFDVIEGSESVCKD